MITLLKKAPFLATAIEFATSKVRLALEYLLIGLVVVCAATSVTLWYRTKTLESKNESLHGRVATNEIINQRQDETIADLKVLRAQDAKTMVGLIADYARLSKSDGKARKKLSDLENENANVRAYLDQPLPPELACVLNSACGPAAGDRRR